jgi:alkylation response protein AidB-like acyl-CoA dehydrogenase
MNIETQVMPEGLAEVAARLAVEFDGRAAAHDSDDSFVAENFARLREEGLLAAGVPVELGGGGADVRALANMLRILGHGCGSTALAVAMHTHQVAIPAWRWTHQPAAKAAVEPLLKRVAASGAVVVTSGGSDWIGSSGRAEKVEGGYRIHARKAFASGSPVGTVFMTSAIAGDKIVHFAAPFDAPEVQRLDTWRTLGMRGTGSGDIQIDGLFVPDDKIALSRNAGEWHPLWHIIATTAFPLIYAVYLGIAEAARDIAVAGIAKRDAAARNRRLLGEMDSALWSARVAHQAMIAVVERNAPSAVTVNEVMFGRRAVEAAVLKTVELAMEAAGGSGFYRASALERRFRDIQASRYHPMRRDTQQEFAGALALGESVAQLF